MATGAGETLGFRSICKLSIEPAEILWLDSGSLEINTPRLYKKSVAELKKFLAAVETHILEGEDKRETEIRNEIRGLLHPDESDDEELKFIRLDEKLTDTHYIDYSVVLLSIVFCMKHEKKIPDPIQYIYCRMIEDFYLGRAAKTLDATLNIKPPKNFNIRALRKRQVRSYRVYIFIEK